MENFRRAIGLRIKENKEVYEGEVTELTPGQYMHISHASSSSCHHHHHSTTSSASLASSLLFLSLLLGSHLSSHSLLHANRLSCAILLISLFTTLILLIEYTEAAAVPGGAGAGAGYGKVVSQVIISLKTVKGTKQLKLDPVIFDSLTKEKVRTGDVIYIEANSGAVRRVGRCDAYATEFDLEAEE